MDPRGAADRIVELARTGEINADHVDVEELVLGKLNDELMAGLDQEAVAGYVKDLMATKPESQKEWTKSYNKLRKKYKMCPRKAQLKYVYRKLVKRGEIEVDELFEEFCMAKAVRSASGVLVITVFTSAYPKFNGKTQTFSCKHDCHYCPKEPGLPRSYLSEEPGVARGKRHKWDPVDQFYARAWTHCLNGHPVDKIELLVLGGTWSEYPHGYQEEFLRDIFWSANTFHDKAPKREKSSLAEEQLYNESARVKIIGVTLETRPDSITVEELKRMRRYGCTRIQLGIQHTNDDILKLVNRGCYRRHAVKATQLSKDIGFKLDFHLMPDLPGATPELDMEMFKDVLHGTELQADQWKIYPCEVVPWTKIKDWFESGEYVPYEEKVLFELILEVKKMVHPWIRLNRVIRDIPNQYIMGGNEITNLRQILATELKKRGERCRCIRCREVGLKKTGHDKAVLIERTYESSGGMEYFLSFESPDEHTIYGFVRLRLSPNAGLGGAFPELVNTALIRELHVYGRLRAVGESKKKKGESQHVGFGTRLMKRAEEISRAHGYCRTGVIAGIGTRNYYRKLGYELEGTYMCKNIESVPSFPLYCGVAVAGVTALSCYKNETFGIVTGLSVMTGCYFAHQTPSTRQINTTNVVVGGLLLSGCLYMSKAFN